MLTVKAERKEAPSRLLELVRLLLYVWVLSGFLLGAVRPELLPAVVVPAGLSESAVLACCFITALLVVFGVEIASMLVFIAALAVYKCSRRLLRCPE
jgi:hypothetical protein